MLPIIFSTLAFASSPTELPKDILKEQKSVNLAGFFIAEGKEGTKKYASPVVILPAPKGYIVHWVQGAKTTMGFGVLEDGVFTVSWKQGDINGVSIYKMTDKGLVGRWSTPLQSGEERLIRIATFGKEMEDEENPDA